MAPLEDLQSYLTRTDAFDRIRESRHAVLAGLSPAAAVLVAATIPAPWLFVYPDATSAKKAVLDLGAYGAE
ncbi:MAG: hypothetical protein KGR26_07630, partial [Cyanobacteria bacterium REEB65]|nr:hypothetical protein [Cyanobacteria bacterium REEB65]